MRIPITTDIVCKIITFNIKTPIYTNTKKTLAKTYVSYSGFYRLWFLVYLGGKKTHTTARIGGFIDLIGADTEAEGSVRYTFETIYSIFTYCTLSTCTYFTHLTMDF